MGWDSGRRYLYFRFTTGRRKIRKRVRIWIQYEVEGGFEFELIRAEDVSALVQQDKDCLKGGNSNCQCYMLVRVNS